MNYTLLQYFLIISDKIVWKVSKMFKVKEKYSITVYNRTAVKMPFLEHGDRVRLGVLCVLDITQWKTKKVVVKTMDYSAVVKSSPK